MSRPTIILALSGLLWLLPAMAAAQEAPAALPDLDAHDITRGEFTQRRRLPELNRPLVSNGRFVHDTERGILWEVLEPAPSTLVIAPRGVYQNGQRHGAGNPVAALRPVFRALFSGDMRSLHDYFEVSERTTDSGWRLELRPRDDTLASALESITLHGDEFPREVVIHDTEGGVTELRFSAIEYPDSLEPSEKRAFDRGRQENTD